VMRLGQKLIESLKEAIAGDFARVTIDGVTWVRSGELERLREQLRLANIDACNASVRIEDLEREVDIAQGNTDAAIEDYNDALARIKELESER